MPPGGAITSDSDLESVLSLQTKNPKVRRNSTGPKYYCSIKGCGQSFKRLDHLDRHEYKHTGIKRHACHYDDCTKTYTIVTHLKRHIRTTHERHDHEPIKNVACEVDSCHKLFTSISNMHRHIREVHENPKVYKCQYCEEKFSQKLKMRRHEISKHTGVYPYKCDKCSKGFYQKWQWEKHEELCKVYPCPTCDKQFDKWTLFQKHCKETQHSRKYYKCEYCNRVYVKPGELQKHVAAKHLQIDDTSSNGADFKCSYEGCQKSYAYERNLRQHVATTHEGKKFDCSESECDKVFSSLQNLQKHLTRDHSKHTTNDKEQPTSSSKIEQRKSLKRKKRKDAGISKVSNLAKLSGLSVDKDMNKRLKSRNSQALEEVTQHLSQEMDINSNSEEERDESEDQEKSIVSLIQNDVIMEPEQSIQVKESAMKNSTLDLEQNEADLDSITASVLTAKDAIVSLIQNGAIMEHEQSKNVTEKESAMKNSTTLDLQQNEADLDSLMTSVLRDEHD